MGYDTNGMLGIRQINNLHRGNGNGRDVMIFRSREYIQGKMGDRDIDKADLRERKRVLLSQKPSAASPLRRCQLKFGVKWGVKSDCSPFSPVPGKLFQG